MAGETETRPVNVPDAPSAASPPATLDERLEFVLAASRTGIWEWDMTTNALTWSDAIFRQHGLDPGQPAPDFESYLRMLPAEDARRLTAAISGAVEGDGRFDLEFRIRWPDGSIHWTRGSGRVFRDERGRPARMLGTGQDITARRRLEEERDRLLAEARRTQEFREAFVDVLSHELRTPITSILGLAEVLAHSTQADDPALRAELLDDVRSEAERLHRLVEDLLVLGRAEHDRLEVDMEPLQPRRILERIVERERAGLPSLAIELRIEPDLPIVSGDPMFVEQVVRNLLGNAAKYTPAGTRVVVSAERDAEGVAFRVSDEGPGIPTDSIDRLFELFYRDPESARSVSGSGIGLYVCATLMQAMNGRIWARRREEGGSEFGFTLRAIAPDEDDEGDDVGAGERGGPRAGP